MAPAENAHVARDGRWLATYVPAALRLYPFAISPQSPDALLRLYDQSKKLSPTPIGARLFNTTGEQSESFDKVNKFADAFHNGVTLACDLAARLEKSGLHRPAHGIPALATLPENLYFIGSRNAYARLNLGSVLSLNKSGATELFWAHITSVQAFRHFVRQHNVARNATERGPKISNWLWDRNSRLLRSRSSLIS